METMFKRKINPYSSKFNIKKVNFHSVLDKVEHLNFVPANFYWNDMGVFHSIGDIVGGKNAVMKGNLFELNSSGNIISINIYKCLICNKTKILIS